MNWRAAGKVFVTSVGMALIGFVVGSLAAATTAQAAARTKADTSARKGITSFNTPKLTKPVSISDAKKAGFTVLKKTSKGEYERQ